MFRSPITRLVAVTVAVAAVIALVLGLTPGEDHKSTATAQAHRASGTEAIVSALLIAPYRTTVNEITQDASFNSNPGLAVANHCDALSLAVKTQPFVNAQDPNLHGWGQDLYSEATDLLSLACSPSDAAGLSLVLTFIVPDGYNTTVTDDVGAMQTDINRVIAYA